MNAPAYARVPRGRHDLDVQLEEIQQFAARKGWTLMRTYSDVTSGAREDCADFRRLMADAAGGQFAAVIVQRFDRAARSVKQLVEALEHLRRCQVAFVSIKEDIDTSTPAGELIFHLMTAIGQFERALIGDRIRSGLDRARALGKPIGRPRAGVSRNQVLVLRAQGLSYRAAARQLRISPALAYRLAEDIPSAGSLQRSETSPRSLEQNPNPCASPAAAQARDSQKPTDRREP